MPSIEAVSDFRKPSKCFWAIGYLPANLPRSQVTWTPSRWIFNDLAQRTSHNTVRPRRSKTEPFWRIFWSVDWRSCLQRPGSRGAEWFHAFQGFSWDFMGSSWIISLLRSRFWLEHPLWWLSNTILQHIQAPRNSTYHGITVSHNITEAWTNVQSLMCVLPDCLGFSYLSHDWRSDFPRRAVFTHSPRHVANVMSHHLLASARWKEYLFSGPGETFVQVLIKIQNDEKKLGKCLHILSEREP